MIRWKMYPLEEARQRVPSWIPVEKAHPPFYEELKHAWVLEMQVGMKWVPVPLVDIDGKEIKP